MAASNRLSSASPAISPSTFNLLLFSSSLAPNAGASNLAFANEDSREERTDMGEWATTWEALRARAAKRGWGEGGGEGERGGEERGGGEGKEGEGGGGE